jgi:hypothetical protein
MRGKITFEINGDSVNSFVEFKDGDEFVTVSLGDFLKIQSAPGLIARVLKKHRLGEDQEKIFTRISDVLAEMNLDTSKLKHLTADLVNQIKNSLRTLEVVADNMSVAELFIKKYPNDKFAEAIVGYLGLCAEVIARGISGIATGGKKVSDSNTEACWELNIPKSIFKKLTGGKINKDIKPIGFFFPRKKEKSVSMTTKELQSEEMCENNRLLLGRSKVLIGFVNSDTILPSLVENYGELLKDDANKKILENQSWTLLPVVDDTTKETFFKDKKKATIQSTSVTGSKALKPQLGAIGSALLRASYMETKTFRPDQLVSAKFYPTKQLNEFQTGAGESWYDVLERQEGMDKKLDSFLDFSTVRDRELWADMFAADLGIPLGDTIRKSFVELLDKERDAEDPAKGPGEETSTNSGKEEGEEKPESEEPVQEDIAQLQKLCDLVTEKLGTNKPGRAYPRTRKDITVLLGEPLKEGDSRKINAQRIKSKAFEVFKDEENLKGKKGKGNNPNTKLYKAGKVLSKSVQMNYGTDAAQEVMDFLKTFANRRLQGEAVKKINAIIDDDIRNLLDYEDRELLGEPQDDSGDDGDY